MKRILDAITKELKQAFRKNGFPDEKIIATVSNRPDLCEYQCNGAMALAKQLHKNPMEIATLVVVSLNVPAADGHIAMFEEAQAAAPGFINLKLSGEFITEYINKMLDEEKFGLETVADGSSVIVDYGGPNIAKPLHIGHLRSAIIGESIKRICSYMGHNAIGDIHLGDWGLQMGQIIAELHFRQPELVYFDEAYTGPYPQEAPFTISELEEIYPTASGKCKVDEAFYDEAKEATAQLQQGRPGYMAIWQHVRNISVADLKANYEKLNVHFELWNGESDAQKYIPEALDQMRSSGYMHESEGAMVVDIAEETDKKELPPCIVIKSDGAVLYATTDLATILSRKLDYGPEHIIYVVDKRQELHFTQVFRTARKTGLISKKTKLSFLGFGTMNGADGKPYKTREGGVMRLETLINETRAAVKEKMLANEGHTQDETDEFIEQTSQIIALSALKYGDLSNQATKDYIFDVNKFIEFEGNTGPYILYTIVRIKSILAKYGKEPQREVSFFGERAEKDLMLKLTGFNTVIAESYRDLAPHKICAYIYDLANAFNTFYHDVKILSCPDEDKKAGYIALLSLTRQILETSIDLLGFSAPERM